jgi:predicted molibdopterin-dependent oxidoreductase YjgC
MDPQNAGERGIEDGQQILVHNNQGRIKVKARVTDSIMCSVVCLLQGQWPSFDAEGTDVTGSANVLTSTEPTQPSQGSRTHSTLVQVTSSLTPPATQRALTRRGLACYPKKGSIGLSEKAHFKREEGASSGVRPFGI